jgi:hypothetical protein
VWLFTPGAPISLDLSSSKISLGDKKGWGGGGQGLRSRSNEGDHKTEKGCLTLAIMGVPTYKPDPENSCLCWHFTTACNGLGGDPGCKGKGSNYCPKMPPNCGQVRLDSGPSR